MTKKQTHHEDDLSYNYLIVKEENIKLRFNILIKDKFLLFSIIIC